MLVLVAIIAFPIGVGASIYLEEFAPKNRLTRLIEVNIANLAAVPSVVYGILGLAAFVRFFGMGRSIIAAALTLSLLVLPIIIVASREALRAVPRSIREGGLALGATRWQTVRSQVLPAALPGILTGTILALSRAIGEAAPMILVGAAAFIASDPSSLELVVHGAADPDLQLDGPATTRVPRDRRCRHYRPHRRVAGPQPRGDPPSQQVHSKVVMA